MNRKWIKAAALLVGLPLFLLSCEKDALRHGSGEKVTINFTVSNGDYGADQIMRSEKIKDSETVSIPLNGNYFLSATLTPEPAEETTFDGSQLRDAADFALNQKIRFMAFNGSVEVGSAIYTWNGTKFTPDDEPLGVEPDNEVLYHFVAYSFFGDPTTEPDDEDMEAGILPAQDLVWGEKDQKIYNNETSRTVPILMQHKFSRVQVKVDVSTIDDAKVTDVSGVVIAGGKKADLTVRTGSLAASTAAGSDVTATMEDWKSENNGKARLSGYKLFYPELTTITFATLDLEIDGAPLPLTNKSVTFTQTLDANTSYKVVVDVRKYGWAGSNIYWKEVSDSGDPKYPGYLTFDKVATLTADNPLSSRYYQGVLFMWGSLIGVAPIDSYYIFLFIPVNGGSWDRTKSRDEAHSLWPGAGTWINMPHLSGSASFDRSDNYVYNQGFTDYTGDICNYIDEDWRLPNSAEFGALEDYSPFIVNGFNTDNASYGIASVRNGRMYNPAAVFFPTPGSRLKDDGGSYGAYAAGVEGRYWSGSRGQTAGLPYILAFNSSYVGPNYQDFDTAAYAVRCIHKLPTD
jgi:hypothetical protein